MTLLEFSGKFQKGVAELPASYKEKGRRMSMKMHFLHSLLDFFLKILVNMVKDCVKTSKLWKKGIEEFKMRV